MANIKRYMVNTQKQGILLMIEDHHNHQKDIARAYRILINTARNWKPEDWRTINQAIVSRWSKSGLERIKKLAWSKEILSKRNS